MSPEASFIWGAGSVSFLAALGFATEAVWHLSGLFGVLALVSVVSMFVIDSPNNTPLVEVREPEGDDR